ncbi:uncharacterized protein LOC109603418 [Aethina tumida]|uniref:uncharacterized protein LOC109603418 n=1 Tax=Aethina tumida TaxID=116153 RepID=UPI00096B05A2|nr:uncharacterized protein LOC109603418 [Aethina tumida]
MKKPTSNLFNISGDNSTADNKTSSLSQGGIKSHVVSVEINDEAPIENWVVLPPDGGWGWIVVLASFFCNFVTDGCLYSFGMFLEEIGEDMDVPATNVALASSIMSGFYFMLGPITCSLMNKYGFRSIAIIGGIFGCISFVLASIVQSLSLFLIFLGVLGGIAFNMIYTPSFVVVGFYFEKWRAMATSLAVCGSSIGMIAFPLIAKEILYSYTWRAKFQMIGGMLLSCSVISLTYKPLLPTRVYIEDEKKVQFIEVDSIGSFHLESESEKIKTPFRTFKSLLFPSKKDSMSVMDEKTSVDASYLLGLTDASISSVTTKSIYKATPSEKLDTVFEEGNEQEIREHWNCFHINQKIQDLWHKISCKKRNTCENSASRPMYREDIFFTGSLYTVPEYSRTVLPGPSTKKSVDYHISVTKVASEYEDKRKYCRCFPVSMASTFSKMLSLSLIKDKPFSLILLSGMFSLLGTYTPFVFTELRALGKGLDPSMTLYLLSAMGISNTIGRIACGVISSIPRINALSVTYISTIACGVVVIISNYFYSMTSQMVYAILFGFTIACLAALKSVILVELLGLEKLTNAFGLLILCQGLASFMGVPIAASLKSLTGNYDVSFLFAGSCIALSGLILIPIHYLKKDINVVVAKEQDQETVATSIKDEQQSVIFDNSDAGFTEQSLPVEGDKSI